MIEVANTKRGRVQPDVPTRWATLTSNTSLPHRCFFIVPGPRRSRTSHLHLHLVSVVRRRVRDAAVLTFRVHCEGRLLKITAGALLWQISANTPILISFSTVWSYSFSERSGASISAKRLSKIRCDLAPETFNVFGTLCHLQEQAFQSYVHQSGDRLVSQLSEDYDGFCSQHFGEGSCLVQ